MGLRESTADDWARLAPDWPRPPHWIGLAADDGAGFGGLYEAVDGRWWGIARRAPGVRRATTLMRAAREMLTVAQAAGVPVHALADPDIDGADRFLARLGFWRTSETIEQYEVWLWAPR